jgi:hypothetical protein
MTDDGRAREHQRQQALLRALWRREPSDALGRWLQAPDEALTQRGLQAYRANAGAVAERALAAAFPAVQALIGEEAFAALARACWQQAPPARGDMGWFGEALPRFIDDGPLPEAPYLADVARLEWALSRAESAADVEALPQSFSLLAEQDPSTLRFVLAPGLALLRSPYPVVTIRRAGLDGDLAPARQALQAGQGEQALVWRKGWKAEVLAVGADDARWIEALRAGASIGAALEAAPAGFAFEPWLLQALGQQWVVGVTHDDPHGRV